MDTLIQLLKYWNVKAELKETRISKANKNVTFSLSVGIFKDAELLYGSRNKKVL